MTWRPTVHGDVKPANLLLSDDGVLKLTDFGIARPLHVPATEEAAGKVVGTTGYLAPEVALGQPPGKASDLYTLGCVLYELCTGQPPFTADTCVSVLHRHLHDTPVPPGRPRPEVPPDLEQVIMRLLAKHPERRTSDAARVAEVLELIGRAGTPSPVTDKPSTPRKCFPALLRPVPGTPVRTPRCCRLSPPRWHGSHGARCSPPHSARWSSSWPPTRSPNTWRRSPNTSARARTTSSQKRWPRYATSSRGLPPGRLDARPHHPAPPRHVVRRGVTASRSMVMSAFLHRFGLWEPQVVNGKNEPHSL
ncbi:serine/threonine-protein kinase [Actinomadura madurae]|uniref:serine/threonine-protein kinase n=1 Tax=Actinomadura madurae TaxID=1993 RepID=UPI0020D230F5|nr:serine/threonine-protein kinase [Actinomadura madurae]MCP9951021.1 serine/threonine protein kinase [Actinomadura madurae]MCP9967803.1 serine/threonine protein kinase [Actinomadura madurae]MCQ0008223.1 serine/threonine protein kinase [Actinomadura madurae]MCQ0016467.1 serine/threonine protein kinase [Actinomadura madurae]